MASLESARDDQGANIPRTTDSNGITETTTEHVVVGEASEEAIKSPSDNEVGSSAPTSSSPSKKGWRFWIVFPSLCIVAFMASIETTIVTTALPTINSSLNTGDNYVWVINAFFLTSAACLPLYGQFANTFGRRWVMVFAVLLFVIGSAIGGSANTTGQLIAGRAIQGGGAGGMIMLLDVIVSDLVPVRERASFMGINFAAVNVGTALGPFIGGAIVQTISWRWVFYINIPIGAFALVLILVCLNTNYRHELVGQRLKRIDYLGNAILIASTISVLFALTYGNVRYSWGSWHVIVPLVVGLCGFGVFIAFEASPIPREPVAPLRLFKHRTSAAVFFITFLWNVLSLWRIYFLSVYFQAVKTSSPTRAGVQLLPSVLMLFPAVTLGGIIVKKTGRYKPIHLVSLSMLTVGHGLYVLLNPNSSTAEWVIVQLVTGFFGNLLLPVMLPAVQAGLEDSDTAAAVAFWGFLRSFGITWAVSIPAAIFNARFDQLAHRISDPVVRAQFSNGQAYERASKTIINALSGVTRTEVIGVYSDALRRTWEVSIVFAGVAFLAVFLEREIPLRTTVETEYGLKEKKEKEEEKEKEKQETNGQSLEGGTIDDETK